MVRNTTKAAAAVAKKKCGGKIKYVVEAGLKGGMGGRLRQKAWRGGGSGIKQAKQMGMGKGYGDYIAGVWTPMPDSDPRRGRGGGVVIMKKQRGQMDVGGGMPGIRCGKCGKVHSIHKKKKKGGKGGKGGKGVVVEVGEKCGVKHGRKQTRFYPLSSKL
jgi:hypothetical protein